MQECGCLYTELKFRSHIGTKALFLARSKKKIKASEPGARRTLFHKLRLQLGAVVLNIR